LIQPQRGTIKFRGKALPRDTRSLRPFRREVQMVFQDPTGSLNPRQTIYEIVAEGLRIHKIEEGPNGESEEDLVARLCRARASGRRSASTCCTRTSSPAASASAW